MDVKKKRSNQEVTKKKWKMYNFVKAIRSQTHNTHKSDAILIEKLNKNKVHDPMQLDCKLNIVLNQASKLENN